MFSHDQNIPCISSLFVSLTKASQTLLGQGYSQVSSLSIKLEHFSSFFIELGIRIKIRSIVFNFTYIDHIKVIDKVLP